jgi:broad specificity phosphatase PhoE
VSSLLLVRHGRTEANARGVLLGRADPPLDPTGRAQAESIGAVLRSGRFGPVLGVVSSPLRRARQTAELLGGSHVLDDRLIELDYGEWEGRAVTDVSTQEWAGWRADPGFRPPGGESLRELGERVRTACDSWSSTVHRPGVLVLVSHVSPIKAAVAWALGAGDELTWRMRLDNASISRVLLRDGVPTLGVFNETAHLTTLPADR